MEELIKLYKNWPYKGETESSLVAIHGSNTSSQKAKLLELEEQLSVLFRKKDIESILSSDAFEDFANDTLIVRHSNLVVLKSDVVRSQPLFYGKNQSGFFVTDNLEAFQQENGYFELDYEALEEYITSGYVYEKRTVYKEVFSIQAGEIIIITGSSITRKRYFEFRPSLNKKNSLKIQDFVFDFNEILTNVFAKILDSNPSTKWILPLSGGHDSRLIANYLYKLGARNVLCYSYGTPDNKQSVISKTVADTLGYDWHFVEYTEQKWNELHLNGMINTYIDYSFNGVSTPHLQDFLAVYELKNQGLIQDGDVFIPGHALDFTVGGHLTELDFQCVDRESACERTYKRHSQIDPSMHLTSSKPFESIKNIYDAANTKPAEFQEYFNWQERQAKFVTNSLRVYEFFGFESRLPFWDASLVNFWLSIPPEFRSRRSLFFESEMAGILIDKLKSIAFVEKPKPKATDVFEATLKSYLPTSLIRKLLRITKRKSKFDEGLNNIYAMRGSSVEELLHPVSDFPNHLQNYFKHLLNRYPFQTRYHFLTTLFTIRRAFDKRKLHDHE